MRFNSPCSSLPLATRGYNTNLFPSRARHDTYGSNTGWWIERMLTELDAIFRVSVGRFSVCPNGAPLYSPGLRA